jgi:hypothetical protein
MNLADYAAPLHAAHIHSQARPVEYVAEGVSHTVPAFVRGASREELLGGAMQGDVFAYIAADDFAKMLPPPRRPQRFDRLRTLDQSYSVESCHAAPNFDQPVLFKLQLRGGSQ